MPVIAVTVAPAIAPSNNLARRIFSKSMSTSSGLSPMTYCLRAWTISGQPSPPWMHSP
jgi:hypothetical protein